MDCQSGLRRLRQYLCGCACSVRLYGTSQTDGSEIIGLQISSRPRRNRTGRAISRDFTNPFPNKRKRGEEPVYKLLDALSEIEGYWNVEPLEKAGGARFKHADTLRTFLKVKFSRRRAAND